MIRFLKIQYQMRKIDEAYLSNLAEIGRITESEKAEILAQSNEKAQEKLDRKN